MSKKSLVLIIAQFLLLGYLTFTGIRTLSPYLIALQISGILIAIWGILAIRIGHFNIQPEVRSSELIVNGPFKWIRNPMYLGILCIFVPAVYANPNPLRWMALASLILVLLLKIQREEFFLSQRFGQDYSHYVLKTKRLIPFLF